MWRPAGCSKIKRFKQKTRENVNIVIENETSPTLSVFPYVYVKHSQKNFMLAFFSLFIDVFIQAVIKLVNLSHLWMKKNVRKNRMNNFIYLWFWYGVKTPDTLIINFFPLLTSNVSDHILKGNSAGGGRRDDD